MVTTLFIRQKSDSANFFHAVIGVNVHVIISVERATILLS